MKLQDEVEILNSNLQTKKVILEPWGEELSLSGRDTLLIKAFSLDERKLEVIEENEIVVIFAWEGSTVETFINGVKIGSQRPTVPRLPKGFTTRSFVEFFFHSETSKNLYIYEIVSRIIERKSHRV